MRGEATPCYGQKVRSPGVKEENKAHQNTGGGGQGGVGHGIRGGGLLKQLES